MNILEFKPAAMPEKTFRRWVSEGRVRLDTDGQLEKRCNRCEDYWPADADFFFRVSTSKSPDRLNHTCKACYAERRYPDGRPSQAKAA